MNRNAGNKYPVNYDRLIAFLESSYGNENIIEKAKSFTENTKALIDLLTDVYVYVDDRYTKSRLTRIRNLLLNKNTPNNKNYIDTCEESSYSDANY